MEAFLDLIKLTVPAAIVLYAVFLLTKSFLQAEYNRKNLDVKSQSITIILPLRLQAFERMTLYLERIHPTSLLKRENEPEFTVSDYQEKLIASIRDEYHHNLSQQIYMNASTWLSIKNALEDIIATINQAAQTQEPQSRSIVLARAIMDIWIKKEEDLIITAINQIKSEAKQLWL